METKRLKIVFGIFALSVLMLSCHKEPEPDDKNKIDIKGSLMNGDMKSPNIVAKYEEKTLCVTFYDALGDCVVSISNPQDSVVFCDTVATCYYASTQFYMGELPKTRYRLHITNGMAGAEGWFNNFRIVAIKPQ